jgi:hypothetical protein
MSPHKMWLHAAGGNQVWYMEPDPETIPVAQAIRGCSRECRYANQLEDDRHLSVLEHSILVADILKEWGCSDNVIVQGLIHDLPEGFTRDVPSPIVRHPGMEFFRDISNRMLSAFCERFGVPYPLSPEVDDADRAAFRLEVAQGTEDGVLRCHPGMEDYSRECPDVSWTGLRVQWMSPVIARKAYTNRLINMYGEDGFLEIIRGKAVTA